MRSSLIPSLTPILTPTLMNKDERPKAERHQHSSIEEESWLQAYSLEHENLCSTPSDPCLRANLHLEPS
jgi:hypothetical protein